MKRFSLIVLGWICLICLNAQAEMKVYPEALNGDVQPDAACEAGSLEPPCCDVYSGDKRDLTVPGAAASYVRASLGKPAQTGGGAGSQTIEPKGP